MILSLKYNLRKSEKKRKVKGTPISTKIGCPRLHSNEKLIAIFKEALEEQRKRRNDGLYFRWVSIHPLSEKLKTTNESATRIYGNLIRDGLVEKRVNRFNRRVTYSLKNYEGYIIVGDYFEKEK